MARATIKHDYKKNPHLAGMDPPFKTHYFYYVLAERFEERIEKLFEDIQGTTIEIHNKIIQTKSQVYIQHHHGVVQDTSSRELIDLLFVYLGVNPVNKRPNVAEWDLDKIKSWKLYNEYIPKETTTEPEAHTWLIKPNQIQKFWLKARRCDKNLTGVDDKEDVNVTLMNLLSFFCGYEDFKDFLYKEFGEGYDKYKDETLIRLYKTYGYSLSKKTDEENGGEDIKLFQVDSPTIPFTTKLKSLRTFISIGLFILIVCTITIYLFGRVSQVEVSINLTTDYMYFETSESFTLRSSEKNLLSSDDHFYIRNALYSLNYPFADSLPSSLKISPIGSEAVGISYLKLPAHTAVSIETPTKNDVYFDFSEQVGLEGHLILRNLIAHSSSEDSSVVYQNTAIGTGINFQSTQNHNLGISLIHCNEFEIPALMVKSVAFRKPSLNQLEYGILTGQIEFQDYGKSFVMNPRDMLRLTTEEPAKLIITFQGGTLNVQFLGSVNGLYSGINTSESSSRTNIMPRRIDNWQNLIIATLAIFILIVVLISYLNRKTS